MLIFPLGLSTTNRWMIWIGVALGASILIGLASVALVRIYVGLVFPLLTSWLIICRDVVLLMLWPSRPWTELGPNWVWTLLLQETFVIGCHEVVKEKEKEKETI